MPDFKTSLHLRMLNDFKKRERETSSNNIYGLECGDPETVHPLKFIKDRYVLPYVNSEHCAVEIGPGRGRWTRYPLGFAKLYVVDYYVELLEELKKNFNQSNMIFIRNNGTDFPSIQENSIDYLFSFGTFVHLDTHLIKAYLENMRRIVTPSTNIVIQYSDKNKIMAQMNDGFSDNTPDKMREMVLNAGYKILEEDLTTMWHSSIIRFAPRAK